MKTKVTLFKTDNEKVPATMEIFIVATQTEHGLIIHNGNNGIDETEKKISSANSAMNFIILPSSVSFLYNILISK